MLRVGTNAADDVTPLLWAKATGMFAKAGLNVDIQKMTSGSAVTAAVIGGSAGHRPHQSVAVDQRAQSRRADHVDRTRRGFDR